MEPRDDMPQAEAMQGKMLHGRSRPDPIPFDRRKELMSLAQKHATSVVQEKVKPEEVRFFLMLMSQLLDKTEW
jgi:hypothetical protein